jgi:hypothetical protein
LLLLGLATAQLVRGREVAGGVLAGLLAYKPQLAAPLLGLLVWRGRWHAVGGAIAAIAVGYLAGVLATGGDATWPDAWLDTIAAYRDADLLANGWQAVSLPALGARLSAVTGVPGLEEVGYVAGGALVIACLPALRRLPVVESVALAAALGLVVSPHAWVYDATLLLPALGVLAIRASRRGWPWQDRWWLAAAFGIALLWPLGGVLGVTVLPVVVAATPLALLEWGPFRRAGDRAAVSAPSQAAPVGSLPLGQ